jgi:hypothetical protein
LWEEGNETEREGGIERERERERQRERERDRERSQSQVLNYAVLAFFK